MTVEHYHFPEGLQVTLDDTYNDPVELAWRNNVYGKSLLSGMSHVFSREGRKTVIIPRRQGDAVIYDTQQEYEAIEDYWEEKKPFAKNQDDVQIERVVLNSDNPTFVQATSHNDVSWTFYEIFHYRPNTPKGE